jgi:aminomethyltransferase
MVANLGDRLAWWECSRKGWTCGDRGGAARRRRAAAPTDRALVALAGTEGGGAAGHARAGVAALAASWASETFDVAGRARPDHRKRLHRGGRGRGLVAAGGRGALGALALCWRRRACSPPGSRAGLACGWRPGLCLYGNDIDETTSPVEANLTWTIGKRRRMAWDFAGADRVRRELDNGPARLRVGIRPEGRQPARGHTPVHAPSGEASGRSPPAASAPP